ncbi:MAG: hypothetical protein Q4A69_09320 [Moraxella sp.]|nr:hypothetical protein [Moraxella sp.]
MKVEVDVDFQALINKIEYELDTNRIENTSISNPKRSQIILKTLNYALNVVTDVLENVE